MPGGWEGERLAHHSVCLCPFPLPPGELAQILKMQVPQGSWAYNYYPLLMPPAGDREGKSLALSIPGM